MESPFPANEDRALYELCCLIPCREEHRAMPDSHMLIFGFEPEISHWRWLLKTVAIRSSMLALGVACIPAFPMALAGLAAAWAAGRVASRLGHRAWQTKATSLRSWTIGRSEATANLFERLAFMGDPMSRGLFAYQRMACLWTRSICAAQCPPNGLASPSIASEAKPEILAEMGKALAMSWTGAKHWSAALSRASMGPEDFDAVDRHWQASGLRPEWAPSKELPSYGALRMACALLMEPISGKFRGQADRARSLAARRERAELAEGLQPSQSSINARRL